MAEGVNIVLCLDEFEGLFLNLQEFTNGFFNHLRAMINQRKLALVMAARQPLEVYSVENQLTSPFFNLFSITELGNFTSEDVECFISHYHPTVQFINWYSEPHPLKLQIFCDVMLQWRGQDWDNDTALAKISKEYAILGGTHDWRKWKRNVIGILSGESISKWLNNLKSLRDLGMGK